MRQLDIFKDKEVEKKELYEGGELSIK